MLLKYLLFGQTHLARVTDKQRKTGTNKTVAFVSDDGDVVQGNAVEPYVGSYKRRKTRTNRSVAFVPDDGDVVQGNVFVSDVGG